MGRPFLKETKIRKKPALPAGSACSTQPQRRVAWSKRRQVPRSPVELSRWLRGEEVRGQNGVARCDCPSLGAWLAISRVRVARFRAASTGPLAPIVSVPATGSTRGLGQEREEIPTDPRAKPVAIESGTAGAIPWQWAMPPSADWSGVRLQQAGVCSMPTAFAAGTRTPRSRTNKTSLAVTRCIFPTGSGK